MNSENYKDKIGNWKNFQELAKALASYKLELEYAKLSQVEPS